MLQVCQISLCFSEIVNRVDVQHFLIFDRDETRLNRLDGSVQRASPGIPCKVDCVIESFSPPRRHRPMALLVARCDCNTAQQCFRFESFERCC
jgi:hypothetical protein